MSRKVRKLVFTDRYLGADQTSFKIKIIGNRHYNEVTGVYNETRVLKESILFDYIEKTYTNYQLATVRESYEMREGQPSPDNKIVMYLTFVE